MFVGETGVQRIVERSAQLMKENDTDDVRQHRAIDLPTVQRYLNYWYSLSLDLFGGEISSNAAAYFATGLKGRAHEERHEDHVALSGTYAMDVPKDGKLEREEVPLRNAMNDILRDAYIEDCQRGVDKWNKTIEEQGVNFTLRLPSRRFHRAVGLYSGLHFNPAGEPISMAEFEQHSREWLPSDADREYIKSLMGAPIHEPGKMAHWIAAPKRGIKGKPVEYEYVRFD